MSPEFSLIAQYFKQPCLHTDLGVGDDAALLRVANGHQLAISADMLVAGTHFFHDCAPYDIGWKSLAVNISDMAAMGATAKWATLAIALPEVNHTWLSEFSRGLFDCANSFQVDLIGGDTTRGRLTISIQIMGEVPVGKAITRDGATLGDDIWVSGTLGDAALALAVLQKRYIIDPNCQAHGFEQWLTCLNRPQPRAALGLALRDIATSCIDISDGLLADLGHLLKASNLGAALHLEQLPMSLYHRNHLNEAEVQTSVLAGGDDYELCFTAPANQREAIKRISQQHHTPLTCIASTRMDIGLQTMYQNTPLLLNHQGFDHFAKSNP